MGAVDWFFVVAGGIGFFPLIGFCSLASSLYAIAFLALLRYAVIPADCDLVLWFCKKFGKPVESLKGQVVWITGASSGIGEALAVRLAKAGVRLALSARSVENLERVKQRCIETGGVTNDEVLILPLDMVQYDQHQPSFDSVLKHFGELDILVSNAGRSQRGRLEMIDLAVDRELFELNVFSLIGLSRIVTRYFLKRGSGHHAVTSSTAGKLGAPLSGAYTGAKHALQGYFECLRIEKAGNGLDITMFCPGPVDSNLLKSCFTEQKGVGLGDMKRGKKMPTDHCADLYAISIANKLSEVWVANQPILTMYYFNQYLPILMKNIRMFLPMKLIMRLRDGRTDVVQVDDTGPKKD